MAPSFETREEIYRVDWFQDFGKVRRKRWRVVAQTDTRLPATGRLGQPLDGGGHLAPKEARKHAMALNYASSKHLKAILGE